MIVDSQPQVVTWVAATKNTSTIAKAYLAIIVIHAILLMVLSIVSINDEKVSNVYAYLGMFVACCFCYFSAQGVIKDNEIQLRCAILSALLISVYLVWYVIYKDQDIVIEIITIASGIFCIFYCVMYKYIVDGFGWYRYNRLNIASEELLSMYYVFQVFKAIVFFDIEMVTMVWILIVSKTRLTPASVVVNCLVIFFEIAWAFLGLRAIKTENLILTRVFLFLSCGLFAYVGYTGYEILSDEKFRRHSSPRQFIVAMSLAVGVRLILLYWLFRAAHNFGEGLKEHIFDIGMDEMDYWGQGTPIQKVQSDGQIYENDEYHRFDDKHVIVENEPAGVDKDDISHTVSQNNKQGSRLGNENHSLGGASSSGDYTKSKKKFSQGSVNSSQVSQNTSNFTRARLDSDEFD